MGIIPLLVAGALFVLAVAFGLHCLVLHCDRDRSRDMVHHRKSP